MKDMAYNGLSFTESIMLSSGTNKKFFQMNEKLVKCKYR